MQAGGKAALNLRSQVCSGLTEASGSFTPLSKIPGWGRGTGGGPPPTS